VRLGGLDETASNGKKFIEGLFLATIAKVGASALIGRITLLANGKFG
tara:strand:+ start:509 stop:649 length:141 start_codon:yes stop_codon:yes gene_type:complete